MSDEKKTTTEGKHKFEAEFATLSLEEKISALLRMEAATLGETLTYIANSSAKAVEKAGDFIHDVGERIENEVKKAAARAGACGTTTAQEPKQEARKPKGPSPKRPSKPRNADDSRGL